MGIIIRGVKNAFRNTIRTFSIVLILGLSIGLALVMLIAQQAVQTKIDSVTSSIGNTISVSPAGMRGFEGGGEPLAADSISKAVKLEHVTSVTQMLTDRLDSTKTNIVSAVEAGSLGQRFGGSSGESQNRPVTPTTTTQPARTFTPPVTLIGTTDTNILSSTQGGGTMTITAGNKIDGNSSELIALVGKNLATKNNLSIDSTFTVGTSTVTVKGIFDSGNDFSNNQVIMPLVAAQNVTGLTGSVTAATVNIDGVTNIDSVTSAVKNVFGEKADVTNSAEQAKTSIEPLQNIKSITKISLIGSLGAGAVIILLTMMMIVRERRREIGILKAIGATDITVMLQFMTESVTLTIMGLSVGLVVGLFGSTPVTNMLVQNSFSSAQTAAAGTGRGPGRMMELAGVGLSNIRSLQVSVGPEMILYGIGAALLIAIVGSAIPALLISKIRPAEVMRAE